MKGFLKVSNSGHFLRVFAWPDQAIFSRVETDFSRIITIVSVKAVQLKSMGYGLDQVEIFYAKLANRKERKKR